ncbi:MAG: amidohydrolase family protein, partial [Chloroflexi bacterium]|nr:amidohydrolase family protein [Chloroflexota bacterium]
PMRWERSQRMGSTVMDQFGRLIRAGVRMAGGSDCGWGSYPFGDFQGEIIAMHDAGLTPMQAIQAGTRNPAAALGVLSQTGSIEPGKAADLLLVDGDPTADINALRQVRAVFKQGKEVKSARPAIAMG